MRKLMATITLVSTIIVPFYYGIFGAGCGGSNVELSPVNTEAIEASCDEDGDSITLTNLSATISGTPCDAPSLSTVEDDSIILSCSDRDTSDNSVDYATLTCGSNSVDYYCDGGLVIVSDDSGEEELFASTTAICSGSTIEEEELIVSAISDDLEN
jgi:hypothetical protein